MEQEPALNPKPGANPAPQNPGSFYHQNRLFLKGLIIGALILVMLIPASLVGNLVTEREARQEQVIQEISSKWATAQTITGPVLAVPCLLTSKAGGNQGTTTKRY